MISNTVVMSLRVELARREHWEADYSGIICIRDENHDVQMVAGVGSHLYMAPAADVRTDWLHETSSHIIDEVFKTLFSGHKARLDGTTVQGLSERVRRIGRMIETN